jgi:hypothetical protein
MQQHDAHDTLHFVDPPYVRSTRKIGGRGYGRCYRHEMSNDDHVRLLEALRNLDGMVVLCGYASDLYDSAAGPADMTERPRRLTSPWPFLYSVVPGRRGLVRNLPPRPKKPTRLKKLPPSAQWTQEMLL